MSSPFPYLIRMLVFLAAVAGLAWVLHEDLLRIFEHTPTLDSVILAVLALGIFFVFRQVVILWPEIRWMRRYMTREPDAPPPEAESVNLLAPMAAMLGERQDEIRLSPTATRAVLDGIATRLDERRELARYMIGLLIFLGLLGTFWGLLQTIGAVADAINSLQVNAGDAVQMFAKLKGSIEGPLKGMSTAFGASLFGLSGSLVLGFLELQASQAQGRFHSELEQWLARATSLGGSSLGPIAAQSVPAYIEALLERNAESADGLIRAVQYVEESRQAGVAGNATLVERLAALAETMREQQGLLARFTEMSIELRGAVARLSERFTAAESDSQAAIAHQQAIEAHLGRLVEETLRARTSIAEELRGGLDRLAQEQARSRTQVVEDMSREIGRLAARPDAEANREALANLQRAVEGRLARLVEENERNRGALAEEMRVAIGKLADRFADLDRDSVSAHRRNIEVNLAHLVEGTTQNRIALAEEIRGEIRLLARTIALTQVQRQETPTGE
ncbi:MAG: flagellar motor protein MotA [Reyranella sp.]|uniref:hypothetical protein n=1 Tax=Reyranella sp. TaxID=1929291 RepID=UPI001AC7BD71|nr:hypothetical protein [Reyranella sp.]MBN9085279.1 flagellar motor protein MotA [Reyranella sp.]